MIYFCLIDLVFLFHSFSCSSLLDDICLITCRIYVDMYWVSLLVTYCFPKLWETYITDFFVNITPLRTTMGNQPVTEKVMIANSFTKNILDITGSLETDVHHFTFLVTFHYPTINDNTRRSKYTRTFISSNINLTRFYFCKPKTQKTNNNIETM